MSNSWKDGNEGYDDRMDEECPECAKVGNVGIVQSGVCNDCGWSVEMGPVESDEEDDLFVNQEKYWQQMFDKQGVKGVKV